MPPPRGRELPGIRVLAAQPNGEAPGHRSHVCQVRTRAGTWGWRRSSSRARWVQDARVSDRPRRRERRLDAGSPRREIHPPTTRRSPVATLAPLPLVPRPRSSVACAGTLAIGDVNGIVVDDHPAARAVGARLAGWLGVGTSLVRAIAAGEPGPAHAIVLRLDAPAALAQRDPSVDPPRDLDGRVVHARHHARPRARSCAPPGGSLLRRADARAARARSSDRVLPSRARRRARHAAVHPHRGRSRVPRPRDAPRRRSPLLLEGARRALRRSSLVLRFNVFHWHLHGRPGLSPRDPFASRAGAGWERPPARTRRTTLARWSRSRRIASSRSCPRSRCPGTRARSSRRIRSCRARARSRRCRRRGASSRTCSAPATRGRTRCSRTCCARRPRCFPSRLVHVGGDEVPPTRWNACPKCRARMAKEKLTPPLLQGAFMKRVGAMLAARGRRMVAWDEALEGGLADDGVVVAWQNVERGRAAAARWSRRRDGAVGHDLSQLLADAHAERPRPPGLRSVDEACSRSTRFRAAFARRRPRTSSAAKARSGPSTSRPAPTSTRCSSRGSPRSRTRCGADRAIPRSCRASPRSVACSMRAAFATSSSRRSGCLARGCSSRARRSRSRRRRSTPTASFDSRSTARSRAPPRRSTTRPSCSARRPRQQRGSSLPGGRVSDVVRGTFERSSTEAADPALDGSGDVS